jgi:hypothetical protein
MVIGWCRSFLNAAKDFPLPPSATKFSFLKLLQIIDWPISLVIGMTFEIGEGAAVITRQIRKVIEN